MLKSCRFYSDWGSLLTFSSPPRAQFSAIVYSTATESNSVAPPTNTLNILTNCYITAPTAIMQTPWAIWTVIQNMTSCTAGSI